MTLFTIFQAISLGLVQGLTEFLPVSSTGHMVLAEHLFHLDKDLYGLSFDIFTSIGTTAAVIWYFSSDLWHYLRLLRLPSKAKPLTNEEKIPWWIAGVTVIVGITGLALEEKISNQLRELPYLALGLVSFGIVLLLAERSAKLSKPSSELTATRAYSLGIAQVFAFIPGVSRSGATISVGMLKGLSREAAARFSFLVAVPITLAATLQRLTKLEGLSGSTLAFYVISMVTAGVTAYYTIHFFMRFVREHSLAGFAYYRFALAVIVLIVAFSGR